MPSASLYLKYAKPSSYKKEVLLCPKTEEQWKGVAAKFNSIWNYHNCLGVVSSYIAMKNPDNADSFYCNYKTTTALQWCHWQMLAIAWWMLEQRVVSQIEEHGMAASCKITQLGASTKTTSR
ncbi:nuclease harbi1 [Plakobranchus ocellatus]|uniref:Nuclease harbi1 n=1 Tax=Plakobranchus ocellatus TaxID=259542 RepID=A0AAV4DNK8_9GAST|nr:nuclease harbi1 [Plakobranchus ocellatus]